MLAHSSACSFDGSNPMISPLKFSWLQIVVKGKVLRMSGNTPRNAASSGTGIFLEVPRDLDSVRFASCDGLFQLQSRPRTMRGRTGAYPSQHVSTSRHPAEAYRKGDQHGHHGVTTPAPLTHKPSCLPHPQRFPL